MIPIHGLVRHLDFQLFKLFKTHHRHNFTKPQTNSVTNDPIVSTIVSNSIFDQEFQLDIVVWIGERLLQFLLIITVHPKWGD
jgi:hypothetical protein